MQLYTIRITCARSQPCQCHEHGCQAVDRREYVFEYLTLAASAQCAHAAARAKFEATTTGWAELVVHTTARALPDGVFELSRGEPVT